MRLIRLPHLPRLSRIVAIGVVALLLAVDAPGLPGSAAGAASRTPQGGCHGVHASAVKTLPAGVAAPGRALVVVGSVNLRAGPSIDCPLVGSLGFGAQVALHPGLLASGGYYWRKVTTAHRDAYSVASAFQDVPATQPPFVPILMYHHIAEGTDRYHVPPAQFAQQLAWLSGNGYVSITPDDLYKALYQGMALPAHPVMLTIDDGNPSTTTFKQLLDQYGFRGVYFLPSYAHLTADQIRELDRSGEVCDHTVSHPFLNQLGYADQAWQITANQQWLEGIVGHPVRCFAYPFGAYNAVTEQILAQDGFTMAFNAWGGACPLSQNVDHFHILRKEIDPVFDLNTFATVVIKGW